MISIISTLLISLFSFAGKHITYTGQVVKIESGVVTFKTDSGETTFKIKGLSKADAQQVAKETGTKKTITLNIPIETLSK
tara:strand:+ start:29485 stop:29724 length:240 start_codon:yes stop_codon:yes gene_type:complete